MIYQQMLTGNQPYYVALGQARSYSENIHPEIELCMCPKGSIELQIGQEKYTISQNQLAIIGSMIPHQTYTSQIPGSLHFTIEVSPALLMEFFEPFSKAVFQSPVISLDDCDPKLSNLLYETLKLCKNRTGLTELLIKGNLYKICYYLYEKFIRQTNASQRPKNFRDIQKVQEAIELIHSQYAQPLTLQTVASHVQYSESHFCRIFKNITGLTFHDALNRCRIKHAACLLKETLLPVSEIALQVGFTDVKTFCHVFKRYTDHTPKTFRNDVTLSLNNFQF